MAYASLLNLYGAYQGILYALSRSVTVFCLLIQLCVLYVTVFYVAFMVRSLLENSC